MDEPEYNIFECLPDGSVAWRASEVGLNPTRLKLQELVRTTSNGFVAIHLPTHEVIFCANPDRRGMILAKRVFQIAYTESLRKLREEILRSRGYGVLFVLGNGAGKAVLSALHLHPSDIAFFMVGHGAAEATRKEMVDWIKTRYPKVKVLVLNPPNQQIAGADYNVLQNGPELWLSIVGAA